MGFLLSLKDFLVEKTTVFLKSTTTHRVVGYLLFFFVLTFVLFTNFSTRGVQLHPGQISPRDIRSPVTRVIIDESKTQELKRIAATQVKNVYQEDPEALPRSEEDLQVFLGRMQSVKEDTNLDDRQKLAALSGLLKETVAEKGLEGLDTEKLALYLLNAAPEDMERIGQRASKIVQNLMDKPVTSEALPSVYEQAAVQADAAGFALEAEQVIRVAVVQAVRPNMVFDAEATAKAKEEAVSKVLPVQRTIKQNQIIIRAGDPVTREHVAILEQLGLQRSRGFGVALGGTALFVLITFWLVVEYLRRYHREILGEDRLMVLLGLIVLLIVLLAKVLTIINIGQRPEVNALVGYLIPASVGPMLVAVLLDTRLAYFISAVLAFYVGLLTEGYQVAFALTAFAGGSVGVYRVSQVSQTSDLAKSGLYIAIANVVTFLTMTTIAGNLDLTLLGTGTMMGVLNGFLSAILMIGVLPYLESVFSITSMIKLLELSNPNQELLRRLLVEAPGTYHHSIMVGNLAEAAAEAVGAQPLQVRVGSYYHDIGKLKRPYFFVENQMSFENPHEKIAPSLSALIITSHIKDGVEMGKEARLPRIVLDFIEQHHGSSLVKYFYSRALEEDGDRYVSEETFRYEGPKPQSKEAALIMLADSVEAAVRSMQDASPGKIEGMVRKIIKDKLNDGQLEECDLTFRDLNIIAEAFCKILNGIYHTRIEYPENLTRELEVRRGKRGDSGDKQPGEG